MKTRTLVLPGLVNVEAQDRNRLRDLDTEIGSEFRRVYQDELLIEARLGVSSRSLNEGYLLLATLSRLSALEQQWDAVFGVSTGVASALVYAGCMKFRDAFRISRELTTLQGALTSEGTPTLTLLVAAPSDGHLASFVALLEMLKCQPHVGVRLDHHMAAVSFLWGSLDDLATLERHLATHGLFVLEAVSGAEHCPLTQPPRSTVSRLIEGADLAEPRFDVIDPSSLEVARTAADVRMIATNQWHTPVDLTQLFPRLVGESRGQVTLLGPRGSIYESFARSFGEQGDVIYLHFFSNEE